MKAVTSKEEIDAAVTKAMKRQSNVVKQEKALNPHTFLEPMERDDVWNHIYTSHKLTELSFKRPDVVKTVRSAIEADLSRVSSPLVVTGGLHCGKTWLCAQMESALREKAKVVTRFCGLTQLTSTLGKLVRGLSKQLYAMFGSPILPPKVERCDADDCADLFRDVLTAAAKRSDGGIVVVLDGMDKLSSDIEDISDFLHFLEDAIPCNVSLVVSFRSSGDSESQLSTTKDLAMLLLKSAKKSNGKYNVY